MRFYGLVSGAYVKLTDWNQAGKADFRRMTAADEFIAGFS
jgi:hypothetical protein